MRASRRSRRAVAAALALATVSSPVAYARVDPPEHSRAGSPSGDLRSPDARHPARPPLPGPPTWPIDPAPLAPPAPVSAVHDDDTPWEAVGLGFAGGCLAAGAAGVAVRLRMRGRAARIA